MGFRFYFTTQENLAFIRIEQRKKVVSVQGRRGGNGHVCVNVGRSGLNEIILIPLYFLKCGLYGSLFNGHLHVIHSKTHE